MSPIKEEQVRKYSAQLGESDGEIAKLRDQHRELMVQKGTLDDRLRDAIDKLEF